VRTPILSRFAAALLFAAAGCSRRPSEPVTPKTPAEPSYDLRLGKRVFTHYCQTCHGEAGAGDGFNAFNLDPKPRDLADPVSQKKSDADLADAIRRGGAGVGLSPLMPPWGRTLTARQVEQVVLYVRSLKRPPS